MTVLTQHKCTICSFTLKLSLFGGNQLNLEAIYKGLPSCLTSASRNPLLKIRTVPTTTPSQLLQVTYRLDFVYSPFLASISVSSRAFPSLSFFFLLSCPAIFRLEPTSPSLQSAPKLASSFRHPKFPIPQDMTTERISEGTETS